MEGAMGFKLRMEGVWIYTGYVEANMPETGVFHAILYACSILLT